MFMLFTRNNDFRAGELRIMQIVKFPPNTVAFYAKSVIEKWKKEYFFACECIYFRKGLC